MSRENVVMLQQVAAAIDDLLVCAANLTQRVFTPEHEKPLREHVREVYLRRFGLDPSSERHARAALVGLIDAAVTELRKEADRLPLEGEGRPAGHAGRKVHPATVEEMGLVFGREAGWVRATYAEDFPAYAAKLSTPEKHAALANALYWWWLNAERIVSEAEKWKALESLGRGVFTKTDAEDWRKNVWWSLRALVSGEDAV